MNIMHVCKKYPDVLGGDAVVVANLQEQQQKVGHKIAIVTSNCVEVKSGSRMYKPGLRDTSAGLDMITPRRLISLFILGFRMFAIIKKERPEVIHTHSIDMAFFVSFAARFYHIPIVHTFHIVTFYDREQSVIRQKTEMRLAKMAKLSVVTAPNEYDVKRLRGAGLEQSVLLPNGVDLAFWRQARREKPNKTFVFLAIGRLEKQKGYDYLIRSAALLKSALIPFHIYIVGEGSEQEALQDLIQTLNVDDVVTLAGRKDMEEVRELFERADAAVFPSLYETTPITLLEAWATGTPAIVTSVGILRGAPADFNAAYIVRPKDEQALVGAMLQCMQDEKQRGVIALNGHEEAKKYVWPLISQTIETIYRGVR